MTMSIIMIIIVIALIYPCWFQADVCWYPGFGSRSADEVSAYFSKKCLDHNGSALWQAKPVDKFWNGKIMIWDTRGIYGITIGI